jgi:hypothetical protein
MKSLSFLYERLFFVGVARLAALIWLKGVANKRLFSLRETDFSIRRGGQIRTDDLGAKGATR